MKPGDIIEEISLPFYGILPFRIGGKWHWGTKIKTTYIVNTDCLKIPVRVQIKKESN